MTSVWKYGSMGVWEWLESGLPYAHTPILPYTLFRPPSP